MRNRVIPTRVPNIFNDLTEIVISLYSFAATVWGQLKKTIRLTQNRLSSV
jgi:hypothetical protein